MAISKLRFMASNSNFGAVPPGLNRRDSPVHKTWLKLVNSVYNGITLIGYDYANTVSGHQGEIIPICATV